MKTTFALIPLNTVFYCNGNRCIKKSSKTALLLEYGRIFYFGQDDQVRST